MHQYFGLRKCQNFLCAIPLLGAEWRRVYSSELKAIKLNLHFKGSKQRGRVMCAYGSGVYKICLCLCVDQKGAGYIKGVKTTTF